MHPCCRSADLKFSRTFFVAAEPTAAPQAAPELVGGRPSTFDRGQRTTDESRRLAYARRRAIDTNKLSLWSRQSGVTEQDPFLQPARLSRSRVFERGQHLAAEDGVD